MIIQSPRGPSVPTAYTCHILEIVRCLAHLAEYPPPPSICSVLYKKHGG